MKVTPIVNPFLAYYPPEHRGQPFSLVAPKPHYGIQYLKVSEESHPNLYEVFIDLANSRFDFLDVFIDINEPERKLLLDYGILVYPESIPEQVLYCCLLDDVESTEVVSNKVEQIVNPSFRYKGIDFTNLASRLTVEHLSGRPSGWISQEAMGIDIGYWFSTEQAEIISKFEAGQRVPVQLYQELLGKLVVAGIVTTTEDRDDTARKGRAKLDIAREKYIKDKYVVVENLLPPEQLSAMRKYYGDYVRNGFMPFEDFQSKRYYQHNEPFARVFHKQLTKLVSYVVGEEVIPSYVYAGSYIEYANLEPHTDRPQCEYSISFQVDYLPEQPEHRSPWGLFLWNPEWGNGEPIDYFSKEFPAASEAEDTNTAVYLKSGDGLIYKGRELIHYRYPLPAGHQSTSLFFHYVPKDFDGELN